MFLIFLLLQYLEPLYFSSPSFSLVYQHFSNHPNSVCRLLCNVGYKALVRHELPGVVGSNCVCCGPHPAGLYVQL